MQTITCELFISFVREQLLSVKRWMALHIHIARKIKYYLHCVDIGYKKNNKQNNPLYSSVKNTKL